MDTDFLLGLLRGNPSAAEKAGEYDSSGIQASTTAVNAFEVYFGAYRSANSEKNLKKADELFSCLGILELNVESFRKTGELLARLTSQGIPIEVRDALIAGIVLVNGYTLVTRNSAHFVRIESLSIQGW
ncbi:MAG: PIN domain-containing protein [Candidatus Methanosuratincola sp.]